MVDQLSVINNRIIIGLVVLTVEIILVIFVSLAPDTFDSSAEKTSKLEESDLKGSCEQEVNCRLPECYCSTFEHQMKRRDIPQMVYFGFDDGMTADAAKHYRYLFRPQRRNPNGCPIAATLFVADKFTDYNVLGDLYRHGFELAVHSMSHKNLKTGEDVRREAKEERDKISSLTGVPIEDIVGWRSPNLITAGDAQDSVLKELGFEYDISLTYVRSQMNDSEPWPFTLDYPWPFRCHIPTCPKHTHRGLWEVPVNSMRDYKDEFACVYVDGCLNRPTSVDEAYRYIMDNFHDNYYGNRAPFGFNMHYAWLLVPDNMKAMDKAMTDILLYNDVYIVSVKNVIEWMKTPTSLLNISTFDPWNC
ncbi:chitin deacetylase 1-like [Ylistrum balloti]|uniref:chitin deacetylase 1-like n=1 Tax=Ylistrum balloti TaxID=509963 RepID=UPI00290582D1|nr:chitin deacetylase 1-like [Ylistrum balloti]